MHKADDVDECWVSKPEANASLPPSKPLEKHLPQEQAYEDQPLQDTTSEFQQPKQHTMTEMDCASSPHSTANTNSLVHSNGFGPSPSMTTPEANSTQQHSTVDDDGKTAENFKSTSVDNSDGVAAVPPEPFKMFIHELN